MEFGRANIGGIDCTIGGVDDLIALLRERLSEAGHGEPTEATTILCVNAHLFNMAWEDAGYRRTLNDADVVALDGMSMVWAARRVGATDARRCNMTEAFRAFLATPQMPRSRALLIGLDAASADRAAMEINALGTHCHVARSVSGFEDLAAYRSLAATGSFDLILIGCGSPRSEMVANELTADGTAAVVWHVGGGTLNFLAGNAREAPRWMRATGLQWVHRLVVEPRAMWRRYLIGNPKFLWRVRNLR